MPRVVLGLPMYCSEGCIADVIESLLSLDYENFAVIGIDDCSPDATFEVARTYTSNPRLVVEANPERLGMIANWNRILDRAYELYPDFEFFAWASDNDLREPSWLSVLVRALEEDPNAALAYTRFGKTSEGEKLVPRRATWLFESRGIADPRERFTATIEGMRAGPIMYGLHRRSTLSQAGNVPPVLFSDFLFLAHLSLYGTFLQVPEALWYRDVQRKTGSSCRRQRAALFAGRPPRLTYLHVPIHHMLWLLRWMVIDGRRPAGMGRVSALRLSFYYPLKWWLRLLRRDTELMRKRQRRLVKRQRKLVKRFRKALTRHKRRLLRPPLGRRLVRVLRSLAR